MEKANINETACTSYQKVTNSICIVCIIFSGKFLTSVKMNVLFCIPEFENPIFGNCKETKILKHLAERCYKKW